MKLLRIFRSSGQESREDCEVLANAARELQVLKDKSESQVESLARSFDALADQSGIVLGMASGIVEAVENSRLDRATSDIRSLGTAASAAVKGLLCSVECIRKTVEDEAAVLRDLSAVIKCQHAVSLKARVLTTMTRIEAGHLGQEGMGFEHLTTELARFSSMLTQDTEGLAGQADSRREAAGRTKSLLAVKVPVLVADLARILNDVDHDIAGLEREFKTLFEVPLNFKRGVVEMERQISEIVAAIQSYDIARQQIEHVCGALLVLRGSMAKRRRSDSTYPEENSRSGTAIKVQLYQLQHVQASVSGWIGRIGTCTDTIRELSGRELATFGDAVISRQAEIARTLAHIDQLERECKTHVENIRSAIGDRSLLERLITTQIRKAAEVQQTLHLLSLNSMIEASRLGGQANAILEVGHGVVRLNAEWSGITDRLERAMRALPGMVKETRHALEALSLREDAALEAAKSATRNSLAGLADAARQATENSSTVRVAIDAMQTRCDGISASAEDLHVTFSQMDAILESLRELEQRAGSEILEHDRTDLEHVYSASYTTEVEREVLQAALFGLPLPAQQLVGEGNGVELF